jgi:hypothetical protein
MIQTCTQQDGAWGNLVQTGVRICLAGILTSAVAASALAGDAERQQAKRIHDRLTGVAPTEAVLDAMEQSIIDNSGSGVAAAELAMDPAQNPLALNFYNVTLKNFASPWTNEDQSVFVPLNDYSATVIGMIRDDKRFDQVLSGDILYKGAPGLAGVVPYSPANNDHYQDLEDLHYDLSDPTVLQENVQSSLNGIPANATAGVITSRAAAEAFFVAGTNRAMFRFTLINHLCTDLEPLKDITRPPDRIRQDVSRSPGGDSRIFLNSCVGCHSGMDPMVQAFAYYNYDETSGRLVYTPGSVQPKYLINSDNFKYGYVTPDDHWDNYWRSGQNANLGWGPEIPAAQRVGAKTLGQELAGSEAFARCQGIKVYRTVCLSDPSETDLTSLLSASGFETNYNMKDLFANAAAACMSN